MTNTVAPTRPLPAPLRHPLWLGLAASIVLALASFGGGATRNRGGALEALGLSFFAFGHGRNLSILVYWIALFALVGAWIMAGKLIVAPTLGSQGSTATVEGGLQRVRTLLWAWVIPLLFAGPIASRDVYSYLMQGAMVRDGFDPYSEGAAANPGPFLLEVSHDWRNTTTPYGPLHLWTGDIITSVVGDNVAAGLIAYKLVSLVGFAMIAWAIPRIARQLGGNPTLALWLGVANPVMLLHLIGGMHNESAMVGLVSVGLLLALKGRWFNFLGAIALIAVATALKVTAFLAMPFVLWLIIHAARRRATTRRGQAGAAVAAFVGGGIVIVFETFAVVAAITWASGSTWGWLSEISGNSKVINPLAGPTLATDIMTPVLLLINEDFTYNTVLGWFRTISTVLMLLGLVVVWWCARGGRRQAILGTIAAYQVAFFFNAVSLPWYYASIISLLGVASPPPWLLKLSTAGSIFLALSFAGDGNHQLYNWWWVIVVAAGAWAAAEWLFGKLPHPAPAPQAPAGQPKKASLEN